MASSNGKTFTLGKLRVNFSSRGIAAKWGDKVYRLPFPGSQTPPRPQAYSAPSADEYGYDPNAYEPQDGYGYDDGYDGYDDEPDRRAPRASYGRYSMLYESEWLTWVLLVVLPPLGIYLLWRRNRFELTVRAGISAASAIWFIVMLVWLFSSLFGGNRADVQTGGNDLVTAPPVAVVSATPSPTPANAGAAVTPAPSPAVSAAITPRPVSTLTGDAGSEATPSVTEMVYATKTGKYYHSNATCSGMSGASKVTIAVAKGRGQSACPECMGGTATTKKPSSTKKVSATKKPSSGNMYYATKAGKYYHSKKNCSGMKGASKVSEATAIKRGQTACPRCIGNTQKVYATKTGKYYHIKQNCSGMKGASKVSIATAKKRGQSACPVCMGGSKATPKPTATKKVTATKTPAGKTMVWVTMGGSKYHKKKNCSGMKGAVQITLNTAIKRNYVRCTACGAPKAPGNATAKVTKSPTKKPATVKPTKTPNPKKTYVWVTMSGSRYHKKKSCSGMKNPTKITLNTAIKRNYKRCAKCGAPKAPSTTKKATATPKVTKKPTPTPKLTNETIKVWVTVDGSKYHSKKTCSGMKNAKQVTLATALERKYKRCTDCDAPKSVSSSDTGEVA